MGESIRWLPAARFGAAAEKSERRHGPDGVC